MWFFAVSASAPLTVLAGGVVATYAGTGVVGVPLSFVVLTAAVWLLTVGYLAVARHVPHAAPFYAILAHGLGRGVGVAGAAVALVGYNAIQICLYGLLTGILSAAFGGVWWVWAAVVWVVIAGCGVLRVGISARLLAVLLVGEIGVIVLFDIAAFTRPAGGVISMAPPSVDSLLVDAVGGVFAMGVAAFVGYESPPTFAEEARTPRAVRHATLGALFLLGPLFAVSSWALAVAVGADQVVTATRTDPNLPFTLLGNSYGVWGPLFAGLGAVLVITSVVAAMLSFHTVVARYVFAVGRERVLPAALAHTGSGRGARQDAPVGGSLLQSGIAAVVVAVFAGIRASPATLFTWLAAVAAIAILSLLAATSGAALRWFHAHPETDDGSWPRLIAPASGMMVGVATLAVTMANLGTLLNARPGSAVTVIVPGVVLTAAVAGLLWAGVLRIRRPDIYKGIGRGRPHHLAVPDRRLAEARL